MDGSKKFLLSVLVATVIADFGVFSKAVPDDDGKVSSFDFSMTDTEGQNTNFSMSTDMDNSDAQRKFKYTEEKNGEETGFDIILTHNGDTNDTMAECQCDPYGSTSLACDANGDCTCSEGFTGSKCELEKYKITDELLGFNDAVKKCSDLGGKLFEPMNADQDKYVFDYVRKQFGKRIEYYIGIIHDDSAKKWTYGSTGEEITYTNWYPGQPNQHTGCVAVDWPGFPDNDKWHDDPNCGNKKQFVCEFKAM